MAKGQIDTNTNDEVLELDDEGKPLVKVIEDTNDDNENDDAKDDNKDISDNDDENDDSDGKGKANDEENEDDEGSISVTIDGESPAPEENLDKAPQWVRDVRKQNEELKKQIRELESKTKANDEATNGPVLGDKPTLESCNYDDAEFEQELIKWHERKQEIEKRNNAAKEANEQTQAKYNTKLQVYRSKASELKAKDFDDAELAAAQTLSVMQQSIIVSGANNPALIIYALGKHPGKAKELAAIADPVEFAFAVANFEGKLKVTNRKPPAPEKRLSSGASGASGIVNGELDRLRAEAEKTGNYTKVMAYKAKMKAKGN